MTKANLKEKYDILSKTFEYQEYSKGFIEFSSHFSEILDKEEKLKDEELEAIFFKRKNPIADTAQWGNCNKEQYDKIYSKWNLIYDKLKSLKTWSLELCKIKYTEILELTKEQCGKEKNILVNRLFATFFPDKLTALCSKDSFRKLVSYMYDTYGDYPEPTNNWISDNYNFVKYCRNCFNENENFPIAIFAWTLYEMIKGDKILSDSTTENKNTPEALADLLKQTHNLILHGAPGTGKTYLANQIAQQLIFDDVKEDNQLTDNEKKQLQEQVGFVQFHPSYDYTDFVEGLRPVRSGDNTQIGFEQKDGVFKKFCERALKATVENTVDNFDEVWEKIITELSENDYIEMPMLKGKIIRIELNENRNGLVRRTYKDDKYEKGDWIRGMSLHFNKEQCYNIYRGLPGTSSGGDDNYRKAVVKYMKDKMGLLEYKEGSVNSKSKMPYIFIIDEINRGDMSKIFGELFFAIEPSYRGKEKCKNLRTQYANLQTNPNEFDKALKISDADNYGHFFIPENVYIIGTMNDIDRSVDSMDFAFRRRFTFYEIHADENTRMLSELGDKKDEAKKKMKSLNNTIWNEKKNTGIEGLSSSYHIGGAYFLKLNDLGGDFTKLWQNHLEPLLKEYLRGMENSGKILKELEEAYDFPKTSSPEDNSYSDENKE